ncbi:lactate utilization protein C [Proteus mirabilis]|uniref:LutC/YkgG family protein n=1 Tax=Proteus mirabilis TaxID=584 RepID=UPI00066653F0|nr:lactate utilization protein C [Proteus mirabilis]ELA9909545.1 lactate utilization protein C [Proteus mirabilis]MCT8215378.1 lactate utilization protein C [Proteus mirabilis]MCZ4573906.1 lactate utilization protein C [Proteus mirabilis]MCZ4574363.1 lactate utilization protein C [Proteus mirabilis]MCZ4661341.1 lactate utilization protein C [Proteus mirabilis]
MDNNKERFLSNLASQLGRSLKTQPEALPEPVNLYPEQRLTELSDDELYQYFLNIAQLAGSTYETTTLSSLPKHLETLCEQYGLPVILTGDPRLQESGVIDYLSEHCHANIWDHTEGKKNIERVKEAKVGIVFAEYGLAESGGVVLFSGADKGRSVGLIPETTIFVLKRSTILPRVAQLAERLHQMALKNIRMPSCINIISGPSCTSDIELIKVVGVHGSLNAIYVIIEDC